MTTSVGISTAGNFVTQAYTFEETGETLAQAGVTDTALMTKMDQAAQAGSNVVSGTMQFLDSLSSSQLDEVTLGCFDSGVRVTTYGDYKTYLDLIQSLNNQASTFMAGDSTAAGNTPSGTANANEAEAVKADDLINDIVNNKPGCITSAESYLAGISGTSGPPASGSSMTAASGKLASTNLTSAEIQEIFAYDKTEGWVTSASLANWGAASKDTVMDEADSNKVLDMASGLDATA